jgi:transposase
MYLYPVIRISLPPKNESLAEQVNSRKEKTMTGKAKPAQYTLEFKLEAVRLVKAGQSMAAVAATLGVIEQTLYNWVKADREGKLAGAGAKAVSPEQMELARLRAEVARLKMGRDILKKPQRTSRRSRCEVRVH